jgi:hypothetical protein
MGNKTILQGCCLRLLFSTFYKPVVNICRNSRLPETRGIIKPHAEHPSGRSEPCFPFRAREQRDETGVILALDLDWRALSLSLTVSPCLSSANSVARRPRVQVLLLLGERALLLLIFCNCRSADKPKCDDGGVWFACVCFIAAMIVSSVN